MALSSEEAVMEGERESEGVDATEELSWLRARVSACWTAERYDTAVDIDGNLLINSFSLKIDRDGDGGSSAMGDDIFLPCQTNKLLFEDDEGKGGTVVL
jgi:hypothetical protein